MTSDEFEWILKSFTRRAPFRSFHIDFIDGQQMEIRHPEAVGYWRNIVMFRDHEGRFQLFTPDAVCRISDRPREEGLLG